MMNDDMLRNIEYLREKADVSYEEAVTLLERFDGNVMRVLVELERQGRVYPQGGASNEHTYTPPKQQPQAKKSDAKDKAQSFITQAFEHRVVIENGKGEQKETIANLSAPFAAGAAIVAPHLAAASVALMFVMGYRVKIKRKKAGQMPEDVETFVDKTVSNIKQTAASVSETVRGEKKHYEQTKKQDNDHWNDHDDNDNDEGGEITVD